MIAKDVAEKLQESTVFFPLGQFIYDQPHLQPPVSEMDIAYHLCPRITADPLNALAILKSDGAALYDTTDLATIQERMEEIHRKPPPADTQGALRRRPLS